MDDEVVEVENSCAINDDEEEDEDANSEEKLLQNHNNNKNNYNYNNSNNNISELIIVQLQNSDLKNQNNGIGVNGIDEICFKINDLGWYLVNALHCLHDLVFSY